jgi:uncharacterized delta-60 repeat protein
MPGGNAMNEMRRSRFRRRIPRSAALLLPVALLVGLTGLSLVALGAAGDLDPTFGGAGYAIAAIGDGADSGEAVVIQGDGKIIVAGASFTGAATDFAAVRYDAEGAVDSTFSGDGVVTTDFAGGPDHAYDAVLQPEGELILAGSAYTSGAYHFALARYESNGAPDAAFDGDGLLTIPFGSQDASATAVALQPDGKIVVAGYVSSGDDSDIALVRVHPNGEPDLAFSGDGQTTTPIGNGLERAYDLVIQPDGKIIVVGEDRAGGDGTVPQFVVARYSTDGSLDESFGTGGITTTFLGDESIARGVALQEDGKIVVVGQITQAGYDYFGIARYTTTGSLDAGGEEGFGPDGYVMIAPGYGGLAYDVVIQPDGWIVVAGDGDFGSGYDDFTLMRLNWFGGLDDEFGNYGIAHSSLVSGNDAARGVALQADGKIVAAGFASNGIDDDFAVARFLGAEAPPLPVPVLSRYTFGGGGRETSGPTLVLRASIAQDSAIGQTSSSDLVLRAGFWPASGHPVRTTASILLAPGESGYLMSPDGRTAIQFPVDSVSTNVVVSFTQQSSPSGTLLSLDDLPGSSLDTTGGLLFAGNAFNLAAADDLGNPVTAFVQPYTLTLDYSDSDWENAGITDESTLNLYSWDAGRGDWVGLLPCAGCSLDPSANRLTLQFDRCSDFALYGLMSHRIYLPLVVR